MRKEKPQASERIPGVLFMEIEMSNKRYWVARIQYPGKKTVGFGTVSIDEQATKDDIEKAFEELMSKHIPSGYKIIDLIPGGYLGRVVNTTFKS